MKIRKESRIRRGIDLVGVVGLVSAVGYILFRSEVPDRYSDLWSNLTVELIGIWITVRIIDALVQSRQRQVNVRNTVVGNMRFMSSIARKLSPNFYDFNIDDLQTEVLWFEKTLPQRAVYLTKDEKKDVEDFTIAARDLVSTAKEYFDAREIVKDADAEVDKAFDTEVEGGKSDYYRFKQKPLVSAEREYRRFNEKPNDRGDELLSLAAAAKDDASITEMPDFIRSEVENYLRSLVELALLRAKALQNIEAVLSKWNTAESNILTEHGEFE